MMIQRVHRILLFASLLLTSTALCAQELYIEAGSESAQFKNYVNNLGENAVDLKHSKTQALFFETGLRLSLIHI